MPDTAAALVIQLSADFKDFKKQMENATGVFDTEGKKIAKKQADLKKKLSDWSLDFSGLSGINKALVGLTAGGIVVGLEELVRKSLAAASSIGDIATQAGVSIEFLQKIRFAASQSGATFGDMDTALVTLNRNLGEFVNTGSGKAALAFKTLGIGKLIDAGQVRNAEDLFNVLVQKMSAFGSEAQKSGFLAKAFGADVGPTLLQLMNKGAQGIAELEAKAVSLGIVLSTDTVRAATEANNKLAALFEVMKTQGIAAVANLAPEIAGLSQDIINALPGLVTWVEKWAQWFGLIKLSPIDSLKVQLADAQADLDKLTQQRADNTGWWKSIFGISNSDLDALITDAKQKVQKLQSDLAHMPVPVGPKIAPKPDALKVNDIAGQAKDAAAEKAAEALRLKRAAFLAQTAVDQQTADAAMVASQDETNVQLLKGSSEYYAAVKKQIDDDYTAQVDSANAKADKQIAELNRQGEGWAGYADAVLNIDSQLTDELETAAQKRTQKLDAAGPQSLIRNALIQGAAQIQQYKDETSILGLTAGAVARLTFMQQALADARQRGITLTAEQIAQLQQEADQVGKAADDADKAAKKMNNSIQVADELRAGLADTLVAGMKGFGSLKDAAAQFVQQLAEMILKLYIIKPMLDSLFGPDGTPLGGSIGGGGGDVLGGLGSVLGSIFGGGVGNSSASLFDDAGAAFTFAKGGVMTAQGPRRLKRFANGGTSRQMAIFGEAGPEAAVPLPDGRRIPVELRMPKVAQSGGAGGITVLQSFDLSGAVVTDDLYARMQTVAAQEADKKITQYDRSVIPSRVRGLNRDPRRNF